MNAIRTLPILNRPSRASSPAPPSTQVTTATATAPGMGPPPGEAKNRARSLSRQITDKVAQLQVAPQPGHPAATIVPSQPLPSGLGSSTPNGLLPKKGPSPPNSRPSTPRISTNMIPPGPTEGPQGGYMDVLGLRLNEVVNKASAGVDWKTKKGFKKSAGWSVGEAVVKELPYPPNDAYLIRAVLRTSVKSLSIYITRLESLLLPALTDSTFAQPLHLSGPATANPLNPAQAFAVTIAHAAWESCEVLEQTLESGKWPKFVNETLRPVMDKLDLVVGKVVQPLLQGLKRDLVASLSRTDGVSPPGGKILGLASVPAPASGPIVPITKEASSSGISRLTKEPSDRGHSRSLAIPVCLQHFASRVDNARKVLEIIAQPCADDGEGWVTGVVVATVWKGMCIMADKDAIPGIPRPPSPSSVARALHGLGKETSPTVVTPPSASAGFTGVTAKLTNGLSILPSRSASRPPSPPRNKVDPGTHALMSFEGLIKRLVNGLVQPLSTIAPADPNDTEHLAREALHEALEALQSLRIVSTAIHAGNGNNSSRILASLRRIRDDIDDPVEEDLDDAIEDLPVVTLFTILQKKANAQIAQLIVTTQSHSGSNEKMGMDLDGLRMKYPSEIWGTKKEDYERQVLSGFGAAEEWGRRVAVILKGEVERVLLELGKLATRHAEANGHGNGSEIKGAPVSSWSRDLQSAEEWVRAIGIAGEARAGVRAVGA